MATIHTQKCRVGNVDGPFNPPKKDIDGYPMPKVNSYPKDVFWTVRYMDGTVQRDARFTSRNLAEQFWKSLPEFN